MKLLKKILLVDHQPEMTALVRTALERTGQYLIRQETDEHLAWHATRWFQPDLILLDGESAWMQEELQARPLQDQTPVLCLTLDGEQRVATSGILRGYSFFATAAGVEEAVRGVAELLRVDT